MEESKQIGWCKYGLYSETENVLLTKTVGIQLLDCESAVFRVYVTNPSLGIKLRMEHYVDFVSLKSQRMASC